MTAPSKIGKDIAGNKTLDFVTIVASSKHIFKIEKIIPDWWGIKQVTSTTKSIEISEIRKTEKNPGLDSSAIVQLLWRDEAFEILRKHNLHVGLTKKPRKVLWDRIDSHLTLDEIRQEVRDKIKKRKYWRQ